MKILLSNKFYYRRGGDCIYMLNLEQLLIEHGHDVAVFAMDYRENIYSPWQRYFPSEMRMKLGLGMIEAICRPFGTSEVKRKINALINDFKPDVVHLNNIHTQLSPIIAEVTHQKGIRVVWTLHDYKLLCPRYDCLRGGSDICEICFSGDKSGCNKYKCIKGSKVASLIGYKEAVKWDRSRLEACTDLYICPSQFMADKMKQGGFDSLKIKTLCNFIDIEKCKRSDYEKDNYYCFIGRLSHEKGAKTLVEAATQLPYKLKVIGGGPLMDELQASAPNNIEFVGFKQWDEIKELVGRARFSVIPSEWYENNPLSVIEAQCLGTPVLGANIGGIPELIEEGVSGMLFESRNILDLRSKIDSMYSRFFDYEMLAKKSQDRYNANKYYNELMNMYKM